MPSTTNLPTFLLFFPQYKTASPLAPQAETGREMTELSHKIIHIVNKLDRQKKVLTKKLNYSFKEIAQLKTTVCAKDAEITWLKQELIEDELCPKK